jgi:hypothetical protein
MRDAPGAVGVLTVGQILEMVLDVFAIKPYFIK